MNFNQNIYLYFNQPRVLSGYFDLWKLQTCRFNVLSFNFNENIQENKKIMMKLMNWFPWKIKALSLVSSSQNFKLRSIWKYVHKISDKVLENITIWNFELSVKDLLKLAASFAHWMFVSVSLCKIINDKQFKVPETLKFKIKRFYFINNDIDDVIFKSFINGFKKNLSIRESLKVMHINPPLPYINLATLLSDQGFYISLPSSNISSSWSSQCKGINF